MTNHNVAEAFANGKAAATEHLFTDGTTIFSYGTHFPIAKRKNGKLYWNKSRYSMTTSQHQGIVARALGFTCAKDLEKQAEKDSDVILFDKLQMVGLCQS